jgi:hypothetical protein
MALQLLKRTLSESHTASVSYLAWRGHADRAGLCEAALASAIARLIGKRVIERREGDSAVVAYGFPP